MVVTRGVKISSCSRMYSYCLYNLSTACSGEALLMIPPPFWPCTRHTLLGLSFPSPDHLSKPSSPAFCRSSRLIPCKSCQSHPSCGTYDIYAVYPLPSPLFFDPAITPPTFQK